MRKTGFDAISDYAGAYGGATARRDQGPTYASATDTIISEWAIISHREHLHLA